MPLIYINYPTGTFSASERDSLAEELTRMGLECEGLQPTPFVRSTNWVFFREYPESHVYHGGRAGGRPVIALEVNAFQGGLDPEAKKRLFRRFTDAIRTYARIPDDALAPVYVVVRDVLESDWGVFGSTITLEELRNPDPQAQPF
jgi:phenylpyruvate tautomerase PptA (4-oxalocrotonate tautomerase family)